jgi:hypothetical protein
MSKRIHSALLIAALGCAAITSQPATAKDIDGEFAVFGLGATSCRDYIAARRSGGEAQKGYADWLLAYASAFNLIVPNTYDLFGARTLDQSLDWLDGYCRDDQRAVFINAVAALSERLYGNRANLAPGKNNREKWAREVINAEQK